MGKILTTHVGSLVRPPEVLAMLDAIERGDGVDESARTQTIARAVADLVRRQADSGIDVVSDGEVGTINWISYLYERLSGLEVREQPPGFAQGAFLRRVHPSIQWAKLHALAEGAALATRELWKPAGDARSARM